MDFSVEHTSPLIVMLFPESSHIFPSIWQHSRANEGSWIVGLAKMCNGPVVKLTINIYSSPLINNFEVKKATLKSCRCTLPFLLTSSSICFRNVASVGVRFLPMPKDAK